MEHDYGYMFDGEEEWQDAENIITKEVEAM